MKRAFSIVAAIVAFSPPVLADMPDCLSGACIGRTFTARAGFTLDDDENKCAGKQGYTKEENNITVEVSVNAGKPLDKISTGAVYQIERRIVFPDHMGINQVVTDFKIKYGKPDKEEIWKNGRGIEMYYGSRSVLTKSVKVQSVGNEISSTETISYLQVVLDIMGRQAECRANKSIPD